MKNDKPPSHFSGLLPDGSSEFALAHDAPRLGNYLVSARLAVGRITEVRMAFDVTFDRRVVIKRLLPQFVQDPVCRARFQRGARLQAQIRHAGVPAVYGADLDGEIPYFAMELVEGHPLAEFVEAAGALPPEIVALIGCDLARTLQDIHETGAVHRQLMPDHVLIDRSGVGRLVVIGFSQVAVPEPDGQEPLTQPGTFVGHLHRAAPEQLAGEPVDERADVYALGVLLYELNTGGELPFSAATVSEQLQAIRAQDHPRLHKKNRRMPKYLGATIERCLRFDPDRRPEGMAAVALALAAGLRDDGFVDVTTELGRLFEAPARVLQGHPERMAKTLAQKTLAFTAEGRREAALTEARRALAWDPKNEAIKAFITGTGQAQKGGPGRPEIVRELPEAAPAQPAKTSVPDVASEETPPAETLLTVEPRPPAEPPPSALPAVQAAAKPQPLVEAQRPPAAKPPLSPTRRRIPWLRSGMAGAALLALAFWLVPRLRPTPAPPPVSPAGRQAGLEAALRTPLERRPFTARLKEPALAMHRPPPRPEEHAPPRLQIDPEALGRLEQRGDLHAVALGSLLKGGPGSEARALAYFDEIDPPPHEEAAGKILKLRLSPSRNPDIDSERALVFLQLHDPAEAFRLTVSALLAAPEHPEALWNQALALQDLTLTGASAQVFGRIQAAGEPGWSEEAAMRRAALQAADEMKRRAFEEMRAQGRAMVAGGPVVPELAEVAPGYAQLYLYDGVRTATSAARVLEFLPLAEEIDRHNANDALVRYVRRIAGRFSIRRAQLAGVYAQLAANYDALKGGALEDYFVQLRAAGEGDLLMGAMVLTQHVSDHLAEFQQLARTMEEPWFAILAENEAADVEMARGEYPRAQDRLLAGLKTCSEQGLGFRCIRLEVSLTRLYILLLALPQAEMHAMAGLELARKTGDYTAETTFLGDLSEITYYRNDSVLSRAYLDETALREPERCARQRFVHEVRAIRYLNELSFDEARRETLAAPLCGQPRTLTSLNVMANLDRVGLAVESPALLRRELAALRRQGGLKPGELAIAMYVEGLLVIQHDRLDGRTLLMQSIAMAQRLPTWDADARNVLFYAYQELILDLAKAGESREALATLAEQQGFPRPSQCVLGALVADERSLAVSLDASGVAYQRYEARRASADIDVARFVPEEIKAAIRGCAHVDVLAYPLFYRSSYLLPPDIEWSFRGGTPIPEVTKSKPYRLLIVREPEPLPGLGLKSHAPWDQNVVATKPTILEGGRATPSNVLATMKDATEVLFDVPCLTAKGEEYLALSVGADRRYALTASMVLRNPLPHGPVVALLGTCGTVAASNRQDVLSLALSFRQAGGRAVLAAVGATPEAEGRQFLGKVLERTRTQRPATALQDERMIWLKQKNREWVNHIVLTE